MFVCIPYYRDPEVGGTVDGAGDDDLQWSRILQLIRDGWMFTIYGPVPEEETRHLPISEPAPYVGRTSLPSDHKAILLRHDLPMEEGRFQVVPRGCLWKTCSCETPAYCSNRSRIYDISEDRLITEDSGGERGGYCGWHRRSRHCN
jgi:hypothetical protein